MKIGASAVSRERIKFYGYTDDKQVELTFTLTLDEVIELCELLNEAGDVMKSLAPGEEAVIPPGGLRA